MAISANGLIAGPNDDTEWVKDLEALNKTITEFGVVVLGKRTYDECMKYDTFPYKNALNVVMTHDKVLLAKLAEKVLFTDKDPAGVLDQIKQKGFENVLLIGGGNLNGSFMKADLIDKIILDVHPLAFSGGIKVFEGEFSKTNLELESFAEINDKIIQIKYKVLR